jgi:hypothetical protein
MIESILSSLSWWHALTIAAVACDVGTTVYALKTFPERLYEDNAEADGIQKKLGLVGGSILFKLPVLMIFWPGFPVPAMLAFSAFHVWQGWRNWRVIQKVRQS